MLDPHHLLFHHVVVFFEISKFGEIRLVRNLEVHYLGVEFVGFVDSFLSKDFLLSNLLAGFIEEEIFFIQVF